MTHYISTNSFKPAPNALRSSILGAMLVGSGQKRGGSGACRVFCYVLDHMFYEIGISSWRWLRCSSSVGAHRWTE
jgi:hypothetical protein